MAFSPFGGLWTDRDNARERIERERTAGRVSADDVPLLDAWITDGFVILPQAVPHRDIDRLNAEVEDVWAGRPSPRYFVEFWEGEQQTIVPAGPSFKDRRVKLLDLHGQSDAAREIVFAEPILRFLTLVFDGPALAFQSLYFRWGSGQDMHQDSAFVKVSSPREMAASWVALEDVSPDSGELEYYVGSHRLDDYLFDGRFKWMPFRSPEYSAFVESLHARSQAQGLPRRRFLPRKGDVLIWSADLVHGGSAGARAGTTRQSLVTHYCPAACSPAYGNAGIVHTRQQHSDSAFYACSPRV